MTRNITVTMDVVEFENKVTGEMEKFVKVYYFDEIGREHIKSYNKNDELFKGCKVDYYLKKYF